MANDTLSSLTTDIVVTCARTAGQLVHVAQVSGEKIVGKVDMHWHAGIARRASRLSPQLRNDLVNAEREVTGLYSRGMVALGSKTQGALERTTRLVVSQVDRVAANAARIDRLVGKQVARSLRVVAMPSARALLDFASAVGSRTNELAQRVVHLPQTATARSAAPGKRATASKGARRAS
jgi:hypothetical protein